MPHTPCQKTGRGGTQYLFKYQTGLKNSTSKVGHGIDTRGEGGYAVVAPSHSIYGAYEWIVSPDDCSLAECPQWIIDRVLEADQPAQPDQSPNGDERSYCLKMLGRAVANVATAPDGKKHEVLVNADGKETKD